MTEGGRKGERERGGEIEREEEEEEEGLAKLKRG